MAMVRALCVKPAFAIVLCSLALAQVGVAQVLPLGLGSVVHAGDADSLPTVLVPLPDAALCFVDTNGNGSYDGGELVLFQVHGCGKPPGEGDIRVSGPEAGTRIIAGDAETLQAVRPFEGAIRYADVNGDGQWSTGDVLYLQPVVHGPEVTAGDVRLTRYARFAAGTVVARGDGDVALATTDQVRLGAFHTRPGADWKFWDADGNGRFSAADVLYIDIDGSRDATVMDVRVTPFRGAPFGTVLGPLDFDALPRLQTFERAAWCFEDPDGDGVRQASEGVFFVARGCAGGGGVLAEGALRITGPAAGTKVAAGETGRGIVGLSPSTVAYADLDGDGAWSFGDSLYLHVSGQAGVSPGDVRLTRFGSLSAGTTVLAGDSDIGLRVERVSPEPAGPVRWWDVDGDGRFAGPDLLYLDMNADGHVGPLDVRLGVLSGLAFGEQLRMGDADVRPAFISGPVAWALCLSRNSTSSAVYLEHAPCQEVAPADLRLSGPDAGRKVEAGDADVRANTSAMGTNTGFFDADNSGTWSLGDTLYLHGGPNRTVVAAGDVRLVAYGGYPPGSVVRDGDPDLALRTLPLLNAARLTNWHFWDTDGDGRFNGDDVAYIDADASGTISALDVRLGPLPGTLPTATASGEVERLQQVVKDQADQARGLQAELAAKNATLAQLERNVTALQEENARLREAARARTPGLDLPALAGLLGLAALVRRASGR